MGAQDPGTIVIDADTPDMTGCSATAGTYGIGDSFTITCVYDEAVTVTGTPQITLANGATADYASGSGGTDLLFSYTVVEGDGDDSDMAVSSISVNGGTMKDALGNSASTTITGGDLGSVIVDATKPTVSITASAALFTTSTFDVTVTFSESVTGFVLSDASISGGSATLSGSGTTYTLTITPSADGDVTIDVAAGVASDAAGNANKAA